MPAARKTKPAAVTEQQIVERLCGMRRDEAMLLYNIVGNWSGNVYADYSLGIKRNARRIASMLVKR